jgi:acyl-CoA reductase-like NAD-dependent aldehyde dehydrogenase
MTVVVENPRTQETLYSIEEPTEDFVNETYDRARAAFEVIRAMSVKERLQEVAKLKRYLCENRERVVDQICAETGKSRTDALVLEVFPALDVMDFYEKNAVKILADQKVKTPIFQFGKKSRIYYEPMGPVLIISPWNYPFHLSFIPFICAFVAGNPVIMKPSKFTPLKGLMEDLCENSGFIKDGLQMVYATRKTANLLIDAKPAKIFFTGSVGAGKSVMARAAQHLIPLELELGGKDPMIVFDDVDIERTVNGALWGGMANTGQTCIAVERVYVQEGVYDEFLKVLQEKAARIENLHGREETLHEHDLDMGAMTAEFQIQEIEEQLEDARANGANIICGGAREPGSHVFPPTIVTDVTRDMQIVREESFGPVISVMKFKTEEEAIAHANDSNLGLSASVWSADQERAVRVARRIEAGSVSVNNVIATQANPALPFGGIKDSGFGRYRGSFGLHSFSHVKSCVIDKQSSKVELHWYPYSKKKYALFGKLIDSAYKEGNLLKVLLNAIALENLAKKNRL